MTPADTRQAQIAAVREVMGWTVDPTSEYEPATAGLAAEVVDAVMAVPGADRYAAGVATGDQNAAAIRASAVKGFRELRLKLLAALGIQDDGQTPLTTYIDALTADRDAAVQRGRAQAAADIRNDPHPNPSPCLPAWHAGYTEAKERAARIAETHPDQRSTT
jgi:hypothetical protein